jgi:hypothetical protein
MLRKDLNRKQEPLMWAGVVFAGAFFVDLLTRHLLDRNIDIVHSVLIALVLGLAYFIFAVLNNQRISKSKRRRNK